MRGQTSPTLFCRDCPPASAGEAAATLAANGMAWRLIAPYLNFDHWTAARRAAQAFPNITASADPISTLRSLRAKAAMIRWRGLR